MSEITEYKTMLDEVCVGRISTRERALRLYDMLMDARQAHRPWAAQVLREATLAGLRATITRHQKATRQVATKKSKRSMVIGVQREIHGTRQWVQSPLDEVSWIELNGHVQLALQNREAINRNLRHYRKLMALQELAPGSAGPGEAARQIGTSVEQVLKAA